MKPNFILPETKMCVVVWYRNGVKNETLIPTPASNDSLFNTMLTHHVGYSDIRAVKAVDTNDLVNSIGRHSVRRR